MTSPDPAGRTLDGARIAVVGAAGGRTSRLRLLSEFCPVNENLRKKTLLQVT